MLTNQIYVSIFSLACIYVCIFQSLILFNICNWVTFYATLHKRTKYNLSITDNCFFSLSLSVYKFFKTITLNILININIK